MSIKQAVDIDLMLKRIGALEKLAEDLLERLVDIERAEKKTAPPSD